MHVLAPSQLLRLAEQAGLTGASILVRPVDRRSSGAEASLDPGRDIYPASMIKTPLVAAALAEVEAGRLRLDQKLVVSEANMTFNDAPSPLHAGVSARLDEICDLAVSRSDNVATNMLFDALGRERATQIAQNRYDLARTSFHRKLSGSDPLIADAGWDGTHHNSHPPADAAHLFMQIAMEEVPHCDLLRGALVRQYWNDKLTKGLRDGDRFAHKTGDTSEVTHDGGILLTREGRSYIIVVYTTMSSTDANNARFGPFMQTLREYL